MDATLTANEETFKKAKSNIPFAVEGYTKMLAEKHDKIKRAEGELARLKQEKRTQAKIANDALKDYYKTASELVDAMVGHLGKDHKLSKLIRNKRNAMVLEAARGKSRKTSSGE